MVISVFIFVVLTKYTHLKRPNANARKDMATWIISVRNVQASTS